MPLLIGLAVGAVGNTGTWAALPLDQCLTHDITNWEVSQVMIFIHFCVINFCK